MSRGLFIVFEGGEGSGKTTQVQLLAGRLRAAGQTVVTTREPGGTLLGGGIRGLLLDIMWGVVPPRAETLLYLADRAVHVHDVIRPALERGELVISDRYTDSTTIYQGAARGLDAADINRMSHWATDGLDPDLVIVLDVDPVEGLARVMSRSGTADRIEREQLAFHERVRIGYRALVQERRATLGTDARRDIASPWYVLIDARRDPETVAGEVEHHVRSMILTKAAGRAA